MLKRVKSRADPLIKYCRNKEVLTIGCVGMGTNDTYGGRDFHLERVSNIAKQVIGIDIQKNEIDMLNRLGYNIYEQSADEPFDLHRKFDVVLAEEVIEHLSNLRVFLDNVKRHLKDDGIFIVTSPNPQGIDYIMQTFLFGKPLTNHYHTHWQSRDTMKYLLTMNGFSVDDIYTIEADAENIRGKAFQYMFFWMPEHFGTNVIYVCRKA